MLQPDPRWTAETEQLVAGKLPTVPISCPDPQCGDSTWDHECEAGATRPNLGATRRVLAALADAGVLVPPGGDAREEWAHQYRGFGRQWTREIPVESREIAERDDADWRAAFADVPGAVSRVKRRTVYTGPWIEVPTASRPQLEGPHHDQLHPASPPPEAHPTAAVE